MGSTTASSLLRALPLLGATLLATVTAVVSGQPPATARDAGTNIKAAYLYKFAGYVRWPGADSAIGPIMIGVVGANALAAELAEITVGRSVEGRGIAVRSVEPDGDLDGIEILFVGSEDPTELAGVLARARGMPVLTVTDDKDALATGSIVNFVVVDQRVRFEISLPAADASGLKLNSRLLAVAQRVHRAPAD